MVGKWVVDNADGFRIKNNGILIVSKFLPKCLRADKLDKIEAIMNNPDNDEYLKQMFTKRYTKSITHYKNWATQGKTYHINLHSFFYLYRIMWFNADNCAFDKARLYEIVTNKQIKSLLNQKIIEGKEYYEWNFSDFNMLNSKK